MASGGVVLGIETSCDDTCVAVLRDGTVLSNLVSSQVQLHSPFGGVVPELAARAHAENIMPLLERALAEARCCLGDIELIAVTAGPGLVGALLVGVSAAKALAWALDCPLVGVNHVDAHIYAHLLQEPGAELWPCICLVVSGGHTDLVRQDRPAAVEFLGGTRDDAAGEAFDKVARLLDLGYPGGPVIDSLSRQGDPDAVEFPRARLEPDSLDFSFSGLKTAVALHVERHGEPSGQQLYDLLASFQEAVVDVLVDKSLLACRQHGIDRLLVAGGVAANSRLRELLTAAGADAGIEVRFPAPHLCTDNAAMVAAAGRARWRELGPHGLGLGVFSALRAGEGVDGAGGR